jgi:hypothetical protein
MEGWTKLSKAPHYEPKNLSATEHWTDFFSLSANEKLPVDVSSLDGTAKAS